MDLDYLAIIPLVIWLSTIWHALRTRLFAKTPLNHTLWVLFIVFVPALGVILYWLLEARNRRYRPPPAPAG